jgi:hypothetical protein
MMLFSSRKDQIGAELPEGFEDGIYDFSVKGVCAGAMANGFARLSAKRHRGLPHPEFA